MHVQGGHRSKADFTSQYVKQNVSAKNVSGGIYSKEEKYRGGIHSKEEIQEKQGGRPAPGSSSFVRDARIDVTSVTKKLRSFFPVNT